jgi:glycine/D-amino acid oxidase-like deaminating enzyme
MERYLAGLRLLCVERGVVFREQTVAGWEELEAFDGVVWAAGAGIRPLLRGIDRFGLRPTGGRALVCRAGRYPPCPIGGEALIAPTSEEGIYTIGSTYERGEWNPVALQELREKAGRIYPPSLEWEELEVRQGVRLGREPLYRPIAEQVSDREWLLGGFGSRGLLYHALLAEELAEKVRSAILGAL